MSDVQRSARDPQAPAATDTRCVVACLCAAWCRLCESYATVFGAVTTRLAGELPGLQARWLDIEDEAALLGELDIETFPTLLVCDASGVRFAGVIEPQATTLERVLRAALAVPASSLRPAEPAYAALAARLLADQAPGSPSGSMSA